MSKNPSVNQQAQVCRHLRTKAMYVPALRESMFRDEAVSSSHCWCIKTMGTVGPDDEYVSLEDCEVSRQCFEST